MRATLDIPLRLGEIISACSAFAPSKSADTLIRGISTDTREMKSGDLYIALKGKNYDGEDFCEEASRRGEVISTVHREGILVKSTEDALLAIATLYKQKLANLKKTVAITGSVGKTTTKELLRVLLNSSGAHATAGNYNNLIGVSHTVLSTPRDAKILIAELGANRYGEIERASVALRPNLAAITSVGTAHIGAFGSREGIARAKLEITAGLVSDGLLLIPHGEQLLVPDCRHKTVAVGDRTADYSLVPLKTEDDMTEVEFYVDGKLKIAAKVNCFGEGNLRALATALALAHEAIGDTEAINQSILSISQENMRQNTFFALGRRVIDDAYNASLESVICAFDMMKRYGGRHIAILGDVLELGSATEIIHFKIGAEAVSRGVDVLILFGVYAPFIARGAVSAGMPREKIFVDTELRDEEYILGAILKKTREGDTLLFKASHECGFSGVCRRLKQKIGGDGNDR